MCELFGFSAADDTDITGYLRTFFSHSEKNPHGWGMMYGSERSIVRGAERASDSGVLGSLLNELRPQKTVLAHIRFATVGAIKPENCHPFTAADISGRVWTMIHNGTIYSGGETYRYIGRQTGETDSERLFLAFIDRMNSHLAQGDMTESRRFDIVNGFITENAPRNKLNLIICDGELLYVHKNMKNTLSYKTVGGSIIIATVPLDDDEWTPFPMAQVKAFRAGREVYAGEPHNGIFVPTLEYISALDAMHI